VIRSELDGEEDGNGDLVTGQIEHPHVCSLTIALASTTIASSSEQPSVSSSTESVRSGSVNGCRRNSVGVSHSCLSECLEHAYYGLSPPACLIRVSPNLREFAEESANWLIWQPVAGGEQRDE
jgi:hypothetical protein